MTKTLIDLGFSELESEIYALLVIEHSKQAVDIARALRIKKSQVCHSLRCLKSKGIVRTTKEYSTVYSAVDFEEALDTMLQTRFEQQKTLQTSRKELLSIWQKITKKDTKLKNQ